MPNQQPINEILVTKGVITDDQLRIALIEQEKTQERLSKIIVRLGFATDTVIRDVLAGVLGVDCVDFSRLIVDKQAVERIPKEIALHHHLLGVNLDKSANTFTLAMADPNNVIAVDQVRSLLGGDLQIRVLLAGETELTKAISQFYGYELAIDGILREMETGGVVETDLEPVREEYSQPLVRLVNAILADAVKQAASDIHFEPEHEFLRIRYRIDGVLRQVRSLHKNYCPAITVRIKVMAGMNIAETRAPQDGRVSLSVSGRAVDFRVSSFPTTHGENIVVRILDRQKGMLGLDQLGLTTDALDTLYRMMARPEGIVLVTGPTGSGKTTTLYSILDHLNTESVNIMTLEDPVEYPMPMIRQSSVNEAVKLTFASGVRSLMRQDPDIILVGEIRDADTARMALRAAMTGHQVFSTLHTNSALGALPRLFDIGISPEIMAGNVIGIIGQRLVRKLCVYCKSPAEPEAHERRLLDLGNGVAAPPIYRATGCEKCDHYGYKGRLALMEILRFDADIDELTARRSGVREIEQLARSRGFSTLADDGVGKVLKGITSLEEISRVLDLTG